MGDFIVLSEVQQTGSFLGHQVGQTYQIREETEKMLLNINNKILHDDKGSYPYRRAVLFSQIIEKDLIPILTNYQDNLKVFNAVIKLLVNLTLPVGCLIPQEMMANNQNNQVMMEINNSLHRTKTIFANSSVTKPLMDNLNAFINGTFKDDSIEVVNDCLLLLRNILHIPEEFSQNVSQTDENIENPKMERQIQILWNLFSEKLDFVLLELICDKQGWAWCDTIVQLIALIYKDQHVMTINQGIKQFVERNDEDSLEETIYSSSANQESLRSGELASASGNSADRPVNDNAGSNEKPIKNWSFNATYRQPSLCTTNTNKGAKNKGCPVKEEANNKPELSSNEPEDKSNSIPGTEHIKSIIDNLLGKNAVNVFQDDIDNMSIFSSSSDEEFDDTLKSSTKPSMTHFQKTCTLAEKKELRELKMNQREKMRLNSTPTSRGITVLLQEFAIDFLLHGYSTLVQNVLEQLLRQSNHLGDESYFLWLITYFLKFTVELHLDRSQMRSLFSFPVVSYLIFIGVKHVEIVELIQQGGGDESIHLRKIHLVVTAVREFFQAFHLYESLPSLSTSDIEEIRLLYLQLSYSREIRQIILLLLRNFKSDEQPLDYLNDLIVTNNLILLKINLVNNFEKYDLGPKLNMDDHIRHFSHQGVICQYGRVLENFSENSFAVNEALFSMLHHIARKLQMPEKLCRMDILKSFAKIWKQRKKVSEEFTDLIEYVIQHFMDDVNNKTDSEKAELPMWSCETINSEDRAEGGGKYGDKICIPKGKIKELIFWEFGQEKPPYSNNEPELASVYGSESSMFVSTRSPILSVSSTSRNSQDQPANKSDTNTKEQLKIDTVGSVSTTCQQTSYGNEAILTSETLSNRNSFERSKSSSQKETFEDTLCDTKNIKLLKRNQETISVDNAFINEISPSEIVTKSLSEGCLKRNKDQKEDILQRKRKFVKSAHTCRDSEEELETEDSEIKRITDYLETQNSGNLIAWFRESLLDACRVKIHPDFIIPAGSHIPHEPVPFYYNLTRQSIPLVPWTEEQHRGLSNEAFILLMHKLGVHLPASLGKVYPRLPYYWTAAYMYNLATKLGPVHPSNINFHIDDLNSAGDRNNPTTADQESFACISQPNLSLISNLTSKQTGVCDWQNLAARSKEVLTNTTTTILTTTNNTLSPS